MEDGFDQAQRIYDAMEEPCEDYEPPTCADCGDRCDSEEDVHHCTAADTHGTDCDAVICTACYRRSMDGECVDCAGELMLDELRERQATDLTTADRRTLQTEVFKVLESLTRAVAKQGVA